MQEDQANSDEGAGPDKDLKTQNPRETTTADQTDAGVSEGSALVEAQEEAAKEREEEGGYQ
jgi:hypothetical protein